jgi:hypothetical protein
MRTPTVWVPGRRIGDFRQILKHLAPFLLAFRSAPTAHSPTMFLSALLEGKDSD